MTPHSSPADQPLLSRREAIDCELLFLLESEPRLSQRDISQRLGVSVGRVNYCLRALADKGWPKFENFRNAPSRASYVYALTPKGIAQRSRLARRFLKRKYSEYERLKVQIAELEPDMHEDEDTR